MEFANLGAHCEVDGCNVHDFLPFQCSLCSKVFCLQHRGLGSHSCDKAQKGVIVSCEVCKGFVDCRRVKNALESHRNSGCLDFVLVPFHELRRENKCSLKSCRKAELASIKCISCRMTFCLKHRHPEDHKCESLSLNKNERKSGLQLLAEAKQRLNIKTENAKTPKRSQNRKPKSIKQQAALNKMKLKFKATGNPKVPPQNRIYFEVHLSPEIRCPSKVQSFPYWFDKFIKVSRGLDDFCSSIGVVNKNHESTARKLIFSTEEGKISVSETFEQLITNPNVFEGQIIKLQYET